jgi:tRNA A-37 threonylcarbamoyl transferase component Bud32
MLDTEFDNVQIHNWKIRIRKDFLKCNIRDLLLLSNKTTQEQNKFIEVPSSEYTNVFKCDVCINGTNHPLYLKQYLCRSVWDFFKCFFRPSPAKRSFDASITLQNNGLDAPVVIGLFERRVGPFLIDSLLLTKEVKNAKSIVQCLADMSRTPSKDTLLRRRNLIECFGETVGQMHTKGIFPGDLRLGNVLVQQKERAWRFFFLDNERTKKVQRLPARLRLKNLVQINMFQENITDTDRMRFFRKYCTQSIQSKRARKALAKRVLKKTEQRLENKKKPTKSMKKYLRTNEKYLRIDTGEWLAVLDRKLCRGVELLSFLKKVDTLMNNGEILKNGDTSLVSRIMWNDRDMVVKRYNHKGIVHSLRQTIKRSRARRSWLNGHRLANLGIATPKPLAYFERRKGALIWESYLVTEYTQGEKLGDFLRNNNISKDKFLKVTEQIKQLIDKLGRYLISHGDLKHTNILITDTGIVLTDLDAMKVHRVTCVYKLRRQKDISRFLRKANPCLFEKDCFTSYSSIHQNH